MLLGFLPILGVCEISIFPFVRHGRKIQNVDEVTFWIHNDDPASDQNYYLNVETTGYDVSDNLVRHAFEYPNDVTVTAFKRGANGVDSSTEYAQTKVSVEPTQSIYSFQLRREGEDDGMNSDECNSLRIPKGTARWELYVSNKGQILREATRIYIQSGMIPKVSVSNSSLVINFIESDATDHWVIETKTELTRNPVSAIVEMEIFSSNLVLNPVVATLTMTTQVFSDAEYDTELGVFDYSSVTLSPVSLSPNSAVFVHNGDIYMTDDAFTTFRKLKMKYDDTKDVRDVTACAFSTLMFAIVMNNKVFWRNYFVNGSFEEARGFPGDMHNVKLYAHEYDNIPRHQTTSAQFATCDPIYGSFERDGSFSVFRYNGICEIVVLPKEWNVASVHSADALGNIDNLIFHFSDTNGADFIGFVDFHTKAATKTNVEEGIDKILIHPTTDAVVMFTKLHNVMISYDNGRHYDKIGSLKANVKSVAFRHATDESYVLDTDMNFYVIFSEYKIIQRLEKYDGMSACLAVGVDDSVYLITDNERLKTRVIPIDSYIRTFVYADECDIRVESFVRPYYTIGFNSNMPNHLTSGLSIYGLSEECRFEFGEKKCRQIMSGSVFSELQNITVGLSAGSDNSVIMTSNDGNAFSNDLLGQTLVFIEYSTITKITEVQSNQLTLQIEWKPTEIILPMGDSVTVEVQFVDLRSKNTRSGLRVRFSGTKATCEGFTFTTDMIGMFLESSDFKAVIISRDDTDTVTIVPISGEIPSGETTMTLFGPDDASKYKIRVDRKQPWSLQFANCNGDVVSKGTVSHHRFMHIMQIDKMEPANFDIEIPAAGTVITRYTNPDIMEQSISISSNSVNYKFTLDTENKRNPITKVVSTYAGGSPKCKYFSICGLSSECLANRRVRVVYDESRMGSRILETNYRPPSDLGNGISTSPRAYNRDPTNPKLTKDRMKLSRAENMTRPNMCANAKTKSQCHCERADISLMHIDHSDCITEVGEFKFLDQWRPDIVIEEFIDGNWIVVDANPPVKISDANGRTSFCVEGDCASSEKPTISFLKGQSIYFRGIELYHLRFEVDTSNELYNCPYVAYQTLYITDPPLMRYHVFLVQNIVGITLGLIITALFCCNPNILEPLARKRNNP